MEVRRAPKNANVLSSALMHAGTSRIRIDQTAVEERVKMLATRSLKKESKHTALLLSISLTDLTSLEGKDTSGRIEQLCHKALHVCDDIAGLPTVAAVCVYPTHVASAKKLLRGSPIKVASVATAFPAGQTSLSAKLEEVRFAVGEGADEVDMVISRGKFLQGDYNYVSDEISAVKEACGESRLKTILEAGELGTFENVRRASDLAINAGTDFIKTSTGKVQPASTPAITLVMLEAIRDHYLRSGKMIGMKPAGGISSAKIALQYLTIVYETLGADWLTPQWFRFGASSLVNDCVLQLLKEKTGVYSSQRYVSID